MFPSVVPWFGRNMRSNVGGSLPYHTPLDTDSPFYYYKNKLCCWLACIQSCRIFTTYVCLTARIVLICRSSPYQFTIWNVVLFTIYSLSLLVWEVSNVAFREFPFFLIDLKVNPHFWSTKKGLDSQMWFNVRVLSTFLSVKLLLAISSFHVDLSCVWCHLIHFHFFCIVMQLPFFFICPTEVQDQMFFHAYVSKYYGTLPNNLCITSIYIVIHSGNFMYV